MTPNQPSAELRSKPTPAQRRLARLARAMAAVNPDAAAELATQLAHAAEAQRRPQGFGIEIRFNQVTGRLDLRSGT